MKLYPTVLIAYSFILLISCKNNTQNKEVETSSTAVEEIKTEKKYSKAEALLTETLKAHGGDLYNTASYSFEFRGKQYSFTNNEDQYIYTVEVEKKDNTLLKDVLVGNTLSRTIDGKPIELSDKDVAKYTSSINSVIYFATLPHKLIDPAVNLEYKGATTIKEVTYEVLQVTFNQEGGGEDHDDQYHYWINQTTNKIDYLAYNYTVNKGGVRFRSAYNTRVVDGITFQDYINYKAPVGTPLWELPIYFERNELKELSRIETENISNLNK
jgi:hypothetical protein